MHFFFFKINPFFGTLAARSVDINFHTCVFQEQVETTVLKCHKCTKYFEVLIVKNK